MSITQTVEIPANRRMIIDVPQEIPAGPAILTLTPCNKNKNEFDDLLTLSNNTLDFWDNEDDEIWNDVWSGLNSINSCTFFQFVFCQEKTCACVIKQYT